MTKKHVVGVLGLFAAVSFAPNYWRWKAHTPQARCGRYLRTLSFAQKSYFDAHHSFASSVDELRADIPAGDARFAIQLSASSASEFTMTCVIRGETWSVFNDIQILNGREVSAVQVSDVHN